MLLASIPEPDPFPIREYPAQSIFTLFWVTLKHKPVALKFLFNVTFTFKGIDPLPQTIYPVSTSGLESPPVRLPELLYGARVSPNPSKSTSHPL